MPKAARLVRNTAVNGVAAVASTVIAIILTSVFLTRMGNSDYGLWLLALTLTFDRGYLAILDLGLGTAALQKLSVLDGIRNNSVAKSIVSTLKIMYFLSSFVGVILIVILGRWTLDSVSISSNSNSVLFLVAVMALRLPIDMSHGTNVVVLESQQRYIWIRSLEVSVNLLWLVVVMIGTSQDWTLKQLAAASLAISTFQLVVSTNLRRLLLGDHGNLLKSGSFDETRELWKVGRWVALQKINSVVYAQMDRLIIAFVVGVGAVGEYEVPYKIQALGVLALSILPSAIFPVAAKMGVSANREQLSELFHRGTRLALISCIPPLVALLFAADDLVAVWVGEEYLHLAGSVRLFSAWIFLAVFHVVGATMLMATKHNRELFWIGFLANAVNLPVSIWLSHYWGMNGVISGTLCGYVVVWFPYLLLEQKLFGTGHREWWKQVLRPVVIPVAVEIALIAILKFYSPIDIRILKIVFYCIPGVALAWSTFYFFFMDENDKIALYLNRRERI